MVAVATSLVNAISFTRLAVAETQSRAQLLAETLYHQTSRVIRQHGSDGLTDTLAQDPSLVNYVEGVVGYSSTTLYLAITDRDNVVILHSNPTMKGQILMSAISLEEFAAQGSIAQLWTLSRGHQVLEFRLPFSVDGEPFGSVRVALSTLLLKEELSGAITTNAMIAAGVVLIAFVSSFYFANRLLAPIEMLRRELERIDTGQGEPKLDFRNEADVGRIAEFFSSMSRRLADVPPTAETRSSWLEAMLGGLSDAVLVVDAQGHVLSLNPPAEKLLDKARLEAEGRTLSELLAPEHSIAKLVGDTLDSGEAVGPVQIRLGSEDHQVMYTVSTQVLTQSGGLSGVMVSARDMERLSRLGSHLSYSQKLAALGKLTSGVAHEIKNPLNAMVIHVALLRQKLADDGGEIIGYLEVLEQEIRRLDRVIQGFLRFTRPEDLQLSKVSLRELVDEGVRLVSAEAAGQGVTMEVEVPDGLPPLLGDRELLQQTLLNLLLNACEAMPDGGVLAVQAHRDTEGIVLTVADTGVGIPTDKLDTIFDLYVTTKSRGSGIGLSMVYRIVQLHDGDIRVDSTEGEGTRFTITLPEVPVAH